MLFRVEDPTRFDKVAELGMGYHFGVAETFLGREGFVVLNGTVALLNTEIGNGAVFLEPLTQSLDVRPSENIDLFLELFRHWLANPNAFAERRALHASPAFPMLSTTSQRFARFSAFSNDRRVQADGSLLPGTYVTSELDAQLVTTGYGAVGRYALPNMAAAIYRFDIVGAQVRGLVGTVAPAFGQAGGGVEIEFTSGLPRGSVAHTNPAVLPEF